MVSFSRSIRKFRMIGGFCRPLNRLRIRRFDVNRSPYLAILCVALVFELSHQLLAQQVIATIP